MRLGSEKPERKLMLSRPMLNLMRKKNSVSMENRSIAFTTRSLKLKLKLSKISLRSCMQNWKARGMASIETPSMRQSTS